MKKDPFLKKVFSPITIFLISVSLALLESKAPLRNFIPPIEGHATSYIEILYFYWFYAAGYHAFLFFRKVFFSAKIKSV